MGVHSEWEAGSQDVKEPVGERELQETEISHVNCQILRSRLQGQARVSVPFLQKADLEILRSHWFVHSGESRVFP